MLASKLIAELSKLISNEEDKEVFIETYGNLKTYNVSNVGYSSEKKNTIKLDARQIVPGTTAWKDYCDKVNK